MKHRILLTVVVFLSFIPVAQAQLPAFPQAQGGGAAAVGGRGGGVYNVNTLSDNTNSGCQANNQNTTCSLRDCVQDTAGIGARTCVFRVTGLITQTRALNISKPFLTIAGQTTPGGGVVQGGLGQQGQALVVQNHDVIIRYMTYDGAGSPASGASCNHNVGTVGLEIDDNNNYNIVIDHNSHRWWGNKDFEIVSNGPGQNAHDITMQWNMGYEPCIDHPVVTEPDSFAGGSQFASQNQDWHHNFFSNYQHRLPLLDIRSLRWVNNIGYNGLQNSTDFNWAAWGAVQGDIIGSKWVDGPQSVYGVYTVVDQPDNGISDAPDCVPDCDNGVAQGLYPGYYLLNNQAHAGTNTGGPLIAATNVVNDAGQISITAAVSQPEGAFNPTAMPGSTNPNGCGGPSASCWYRSSPLPAETFPIVADQVTNLDNIITPTVGNSQRLDCLGNWVSNRDSQDARVIAQYLARGPGSMWGPVFGAPSGETNSPDYKGAINSDGTPAPGPPVVPGTPCVESMSDGIPDQWKQANNLSTTDPNLYKKTAPSGYTYLEMYLNGSGQASSGGGTGGGGTGGSTGGTPTFEDDFNTGSMNATNWQVNSYTTPNYVGAGSTFTSTPTNCSWAGGLLTLRLDQPTATASTGCELQSKTAFGYGTYEWTFRASSTSTTPTGAGTADSGSISTGFIISDATSHTEIDSPEIEGQTPTHVEFTNWLNGANGGAAIITAAFNPQDAQHKYSFTWTNTGVTYFIDGTQVAQHTTFVPSDSFPGFVIISHYGTNSSGFGGTATVGVSRYMYVTAFKYWSATATGGGTGGGGTGGAGAPNAPTGLTATPH